MGSSASRSVADNFDNSHEAVAYERYKGTAPRIHTGAYARERSSGHEFCENSLRGISTAQSSDSVRARQGSRTDFRRRPIRWCRSKRQLLIRLVAMDEDLREL